MSKILFRLARQWMKERGISCMARGAEQTAKYVYPELYHESSQFLPYRKMAVIPQNAI